MSAVFNRKKNVFKTYLVQQFYGTNIYCGVFEMNFLKITVHFLNEETYLNN